MNILSDIWDEIWDEIYGLYMDQPRSGIAFQPWPRFRHRSMCLTLRWPRGDPQHGIKRVENRGPQMHRKFMEIPEMSILNDFMVIQHPPKVTFLPSPNWWLASVCFSVIQFQCQPWIDRFMKCKIYSYLFTRGPQHSDHSLHGLQMVHCWHLSHG
jgi:hypothetical protein